MLNLFFFFWLRLFHPFYVSITEIKQNPASHSLEISCRMFSDDLEKALEKQYHVELDVIKPKDKTLVNKLISDYVKKRLLIHADGKALSLNYVGYEIQEDGTWSYFEVKGIDPPRKLNVHDALLFEQHPEQINMMHVTVGGQRKSTKVDNPDADAVFVF
ncbi:DUF6702 family protein [Mucilaginibacter sp.]|uniref:DUF6702 family protein n=1 Tax=Mucilaginibacter sp. TaxID=1882438 RepID=UPI003AFFECC1